MNRSASCSLRTLWKLAVKSSAKKILSTCLERFLRTFWERKIWQEILDVSNQTSHFLAMPIISVHHTTATTPLLVNNQHGSFLVLWSSQRNLRSNHRKRFQTQTCLLTDWIHTKSDLPEVETDYEELIWRLTIEHRLTDSKIGCCNARRGRRGREQMSCRGRRTVCLVRWDCFSTAPSLWQSLVPPGGTENFAFSVWLLCFLLY